MPWTGRAQPASTEQESQGIGRVQRRRSMTHPDPSMAVSHFQLLPVFLPNSRQYVLGSRLRWVQSFLSNKMMSPTFMLKR